MMCGVEKFIVEFIFSQQELYHLSYNVVKDSFFGEIYTLIIIFSVYLLHVIFL